MGCYAREAWASGHGVPEVLLYGHPSSAAMCSHSNNQAGRARANYCDIVLFHGIHSSYKCTRAVPARHSFYTD